MVKNITVWPQEYIGNIFDFKNGLNKAKEFFGSGIPIVNYVDVYSRDAIYKNTVKGRVDLTLAEINRFRVKRGDVFFTRTSETPEEVGIAAVLLEEISDCVFSGFVLRARPKKQLLLPEYCQYCFQTQQVRAEIILGCTYTTRALTNGTQLSKIQLPIPPLPEQKAIAEALSDIDHLIVATEKLIAKKKDIKKGLMQELLTGKKRLPGFTKEWCRLTLKEIGLFKKARGISRSNAQSGSIRAIRYGELYTLHDRYVVTYGSHISTQVASEATLVKRGDILFAASGETKEEIGKCAAIIDQGEIFAGGDIIVFTPSVATDPFFLGTVLNTENVIKQKAEKGQGDAVVHIHIPELEKISISIPSFEEQVAIGKIIFEFDSECLVLYKKLKKLHDIKQGMMSELLTGRIRLKEVKETGELNE